MIKLKTIEQTMIDPSFASLAKHFFSLKSSVFTPRSVEAKRLLDFYNTERGFEKFITRLKQLDYARFSAIRSMGDLYMKAETKDLVVDYQYRHSRNKIQYNIGVYAIYIKEHDLLRGNIGNYHFIPQNNPFCETNGRRGDEFKHARHLHHYAYFNRNEHQQKNPLSYYPRTCWGSFASMLPAIAQDGDLAELFRALYLFITIQNTDSPLVNINDLRHYKPVERT